ncbi:hypothetical protein GF420_15480 [candidate division GN15 bacterium]|nr:hypothetical protein [candidate division GN15 bacterium]
MAKARSRKSKKIEPAPRSPLIIQSLTLLDQAYNRKAWHGTNFRGSLMRVSPEQAAWRLSPKRHNIWEIVVHVAYYKYVLWRRITGQKKGGFPYRAEQSWGDWFVRPDRISDAVWRDDLGLLKEYHNHLRDAVAGLRPEDDPKLWEKNQHRIIGAAYHDIYHAGQIQLLKRMYQDRRKK